MMLGAIIGDVVGSRFERHNHKSKDFELFADKCRPTDDSVMTIAIAEAILKCEGNIDRFSEEATKAMQRLGRKHPAAGYGRNFLGWIMARNPKPYNSFGNGSAMRVSPCAYVSDNLDEILEFAKISSEVTHNHPEGIKGATTVAAAIYLARTGSTKEEIREYVSDIYDMNFTLDEIRDSYSFDVSCQGSVPQAIEAFLESESLEDAIRGAVSIGGDSDTIASIAGSIAGAYYGIPDEMAQSTRKYLSSDMLEILDEFCDRYVAKADDSDRADV